MTDSTQKVGGQSTMSARTFNDIPHERVLRLKAVLGRTGLTRSMVYALAKEGQFPGAINLGARAVGWLESEIDAWIAARVEATRNRAA